MNSDRHSPDFTPVQVLPPQPPAHYGGAPGYGWDSGARVNDGGGVISLIDHLLQHGTLVLIVWLGAIALGLAYLLAVPPVWQADALVQVDGRSARPLAGTTVAQQSAEVEMPAGFLQGELEILRSREIVSRAIAATSADLEIAVDNRMPLIGALYARSIGRDAEAPLPPPLGLPVLSRWAWGGEQLRIASIRVPSEAYGVPLMLERTTDGWLLRDEEEQPLARGGTGAPVTFSIDGRPASIEVSALQALPGTRFRVVPNDPAAVYDNALRSLTVSEAGRQSGVIRISFQHTRPAFAAAFLGAVTSAYLEHHIKVRTGETSRALAFLDSQLPVVKRELDRAEEALDAYRTGNSTLDIGQENESALRRLADLERERVTIDMKRQQLSERYTANYPEAIALQKQLASVAGEALRLRNEMRRAPRQEKDVTRLQRDVQVNTTLYTALMNNAQALRMTQAGMQGNARLVDPAAVLSEPVRPKPATVLSISAALGALAAMFAVLMARALRPTLRTADELEQNTGRPTLATIPESARQRSLMRGPRLWRSRLVQRLLAARSPDDPAVESLRALRNSVALRTPIDPMAEGGQTVLITSPTTAAGKSFVAANLGVLMAASGRRVLLVDLDLRVPRQHVYYGLARDRIGVADVLAGRATLADAIVRDVLPGLDLLPAGRCQDNPGELLLQPAFETLMAELRLGHDQVLIDSAPVLPVGDTLTIGRLVDAIYLIVRSESNTQREVRDAVRRLEIAGGDVDGLVLNGVKRHRLASVPYSGYMAADGGGRALALPRLPARGR